MTRLSRLAALLAAIGITGAPTARADDEAPPEASPASAEMLKSMHEKGILTDEQYEDIYRRQAQYEQKQREESSLPGWVKNWSVGGDLRLRLERQDWREPIVVPDRVLTPNPDNVNLNTGKAIERRDRARVRLRVGAEKELMEGLDVGFRFVTSQGTTFGTQNGAPVANFTTVAVGDPRSANVTLGDYFSPKNTYFDRAFLRYSPWFAKNLTFTGGKIPNPFVSGNFPDNLVWDNDIQPEGAAATYHFDILPEYFWSDTRASWFSIAEVGEVDIDAAAAPILSTLPTLDEHDPYMYAVQQEFTGQPEPWLRVGGRASYYDLKNLNTRFAAASMDLGNTGDAISHNPLYVLLTPASPYFQNGGSNGRMQEIVIDGYFTWNGLGDRYQLTPFVQWTFLPNAKAEDQGFTIGVTAGDASFLKVSAQWSRIERNGTIALFTDSDIYDGFTNVRGWYITAERKLTKGVRLRASYSAAHLLQPACDTAPDGQPLAFCNNGAFTVSPTNFAQAFATNLDRFRVQLDLIADF
jgi:hypothetical protein